MFDQVTSDIKEAMKAKEKERLNALRYLKSLLLENKTSKSPKPELDVVVAHQKKLKDSMEAYPTESEQRQKISEEIEFLKPYLPTPMTEEDVRKIISDILSKMEKPHIGMIMKELSPQIKGKFDGKAANKIVQELMNKN
ncbi:MAG: GatB/YqeY domain-containing protein [Bdellovibrionota bacterium]|nr:GatB/YqeY domain-containing protein [Bdellovibrionota bacterium]